MPIIATLFLLLIALMSPAQGLAVEPPIEVKESDFRFYLGHTALLYEDATGELTLDQIRRLYQDGIFAPLKNPAMQFGYRHSAMWFTFAVSNTTETPINNNLEIRYAPLDYIDAYLINEQGEIEYHAALGDHRPYSEREIKSRNHVAPLKFKANSTYQVFVRVKSQSSLSSMMYLSSMDKLYQYEHYIQMIMGMFYGLALGLFFYNLFLFVIIRDPVYLHYILYVAGYTLFMASLDGILYRFWPDAVEWENRSLYIFPVICGFFLAFFCRTVLQTKKESPKSDLVLRIFGVLYVIGTFAFFFMDIGLMARLISPIIASNAFVILAITIIRFYQGYKPASYLVVGMGSFCFGILTVATGALNLHSSYEIAPFIFKAGAAIEMIVFSIALAERIRRLQETNKLARIEQLKRMDKLKDEFLANTSHELRTPLNAIIGITDSMLESANHRLNEQDKHNLTLISGSGYRLAALVNNILDFSKLKHQDTQITKTPVNIKSVIDNVIDLSLPLTKQKNIQLISEVNPHLPVVMADEDRIYQVLHNLIINAIKFTAKGSITVRAGIINNTMQISVKDTGVGIPSEKLGDIFNAFEQVDGSIEREYGGTGLGLAISKRLVEMHGGQIWVKSTLGRGACFTLSLPDIRTDITADSLDSQPHKRLTAKFKQGFTALGAKVSKQEFLSKDYTQDTRLPNAALPLTTDPLHESTVSEKQTYRILVVDDEPINIEVMKNQLSDKKYQLNTAENGADALRLLDQNPFDLVLLDVMMPGMSGYEVCQKIRRQFRPEQLPVIMVTARTQVRDLVEGFKSGANDYITKPFVKDELIARITLHLKLNETVNALIRSESNFRNIYNEALEGIFQIDRDGKITGNPAMARILGYRSPDDLHHSINDVREDLFFDPRQLEGLQTSIDSKGKMSHAEAQLYRKDKTLIWGSIKVSKLVDNQGKLARLEGLLEDITDQKQAEQALMEAYKDIESKVNLRTQELQEANKQLRLAKEEALSAVKAKGEFLANMSHEIRTPMNGVIAAADLALELNPGANMKKFLSIIRTSGDVLLGIINDILDFSKIEAKKLNIEYTAFDLSVLFDELEEIFGAQIALSGKPVVLNKHLTDELPPAVIGDRIRIQQVLSNLLSNAVKFTEKGNISFAVSNFEQNENEITLVFSVQDTGTGIDPQFQEDIFTPFTQAKDLSSRKVRGTGLGMTISRKLVELMKGELWFESTLGKGSTFYFKLTLRYQTTPVYSYNHSPSSPGKTLLGIDALTGNEAKSGTEVMILANKAILLAEDDTTNQELALAMLSKTGAMVDVVENGRQAVEAIHHKHYDAVLMDIEMPEMNGYDATRKIRQDRQFSNIPIIAMTAHAMIGDEALGIASGMNGYITKPIKKAHLINTLASHIEGVHPFNSHIFDNSSLNNSPGNDFNNDVNNRAFDHHARDLNDTRFTSPKPAIDIGQALEDSELDYASFVEILDVFHRTNLSKVDEINALYHQADWDKLRSKAHAIKGSAANICAYDLNVAARQLEEACDMAKTTGASPREELLLSLESRLIKVLTEIDQLPNVMTDTYQENTLPLDKVALSQVENLIGLLNHALEDSEPSKVKKYYTQLLTLIGATKTSHLKDYLDTFEYGKAIEELDNIAKALFPES